jgi:hypothetical protein
MKQQHISISKSVRAVRLSTVAALLAVLGATLAAVPATWAQGAQTSINHTRSGWPETFGLADRRPAPSPEDLAAPVPSAPSVRLGIDLRLPGTVPQVALAPVDVQALRREDAVREQQSMNKVLRYGVGRAVHATAADGNWYRLAGGGRLWVLEIVSPGALGVRLHFANLQLPRAAEIAVYAPGDASNPSNTVLYDGDQPSLVSRELWTPTVFGERARVEVRLPAGSGLAAGRLPFSIDRLQHIYRDPVAETAAGVKAAGPCHNDVTCYPEWADVARAVGGLGTIFNNDSLYCTGQLLNSQSADQTPYFLTAHHCLSTQTDANNAEFFWLYQTATCGGAPPSLTSVPRTARATLLATGPETASDYTLLMIQGALPRNLFWAGWTAAPVADNTASADIHHPAGDYKRISFGKRSPQPAVCNTTLPDHVRVDWTNAPTEPGSSGSGIFRADTQQLYGQLHCGPSACGEDPANMNDSFGAFSATYPHLATFLAGGTDDTFEDNETCEVAHRAAPATYKNLIVKFVDPDWYRLNIPPGKTLTVTVTYTRDWGNIGLRLYGDCSSAPLAVANAAGNKQTLTITNHGPDAAFYRWQAFLRTGVRNTYTMTVAVR